MARSDASAALRFQRKAVDLSVQDGPLDCWHLHVAFASRDLGEFIDFPQNPGGFTNCCMSCILSRSHAL